MAKLAVQVNNVHLTLCTFNKKKIRKENAEPKQNTVYTRSMRVFAQKARNINDKSSEIMIHMEKSTEIS